MNCNTGPILNVNDWSILSSPDYYTIQCSSVSGSGMPVNYFGSCIAKNGNAYVGIGTIGYPYETKEYVYQNLSSPLIAGKSYYVSFFLSMSDRTRIATEKIGAYFSVNQPTVASGTICLLATPQVENHSGFLTDTINWTMIEGYFTAQGGEQYITIGNFNSNADTDTLHTGTTNPFFSDAGTAYYYVDSVSLYDAATITEVHDLKNEMKFNLYPNPTAGKLKLSVDAKDRTGLSIQITDVLGRNIKKLEYEEEIDISELDRGIYFLSLYEKERLVGTKKIIKE